MSDQRPTSFQAGLAAWRNGQVAEAEEAFRQAVAANPEDAVALYNLGLACFHNNKAADAEAVLARALELRPGHTDTQAILAAVLAEQGKIERAVVLADAVVGQSSEPSQLNTAGHVLTASGRPDAAETAYRKALESDPAYRPASLPLASLLSSRHAYDDAVSICEQTLKHRPTDQDLHLKRCQALWDGGHWSRARQALVDLLEFAPDHVTALYNLSLYADHVSPASAIHRLTVLISEGGLLQDDLEKAWFALGNFYASAADHGSAMASFAAGNKVRARRASKVHEISADAFGKRVRELTAAPLPAVRPGASGTPTPIVITGPSRSGKTLLQSCLSGHPDIAAADETGLLPRLAAEIEENSETHLADAAATYRAGLRRLGGDSPYVIDTHPVNALFLDLLIALCPDALIIQMDRNPLDLAVSVYVRHYVTGGHWADTWHGIARRLKSYERLRTYWSDWQPVKATVSYESLVNDPEKTLRSIVESLGLTWSDGVLPAFDSNDPVRPMPWASFPGQKTLRNDMTGLWQPFAFALGDFADAYGRSDLPELPPFAGFPDQPHIAALDRLSAVEVIASEVPDGIHALPVVQSQCADEAEANGDWAKALEYRWQAVSDRPFTHHVRRHADALRNTLVRSPDHAQLAALHQDVTRVWERYRKNSELRFGDFGLMYQSCAPVYLPGNRDTDVRSKTYDLGSLAAGARVLDLGCNTGFLALDAARTAHVVTGIEKEKPLIAIAEKVAAYLNIANCTFTAADAKSYEDPEPYGLVIAAAVHGWLDTPFARLAERLAAFVAPGGTLLFESQGRRSVTDIEENFADKITVLKDAGLRAIRDGTLCDDGVNKRAFVILSKCS